MRAPIEQRFWEKVSKAEGCWLWTGGLDTCGYGSFYIGINSDGKHHEIGAHRQAYIWIKGEIPDGFTIDHLCRNRACVNPDHLEAISLRDNILRGNGRAAQQARRTHCPAGHRYDLFNTYVSPSGKRRCRVCKREQARAAYWGS